MEGGSGWSFSLDSHFISKSGDNSIDTSIRVTNTRNADLALGGGANSEGATVYYHHRVIFLAQKQRSFHLAVMWLPNMYLAHRDKVNYSVKVISPH